jgi:hypothetical protein
MTYPDGIDALVNVNATDSLAAGGHAARHNSVNTALVEIKNMLGSSPAGKIIQIVRATDTTERTTTSTSYVDVTGMSVTITPQKNDSAILIAASFVGRSGADQTAADFAITDSADNLLSGAEGSRIGLTGGDTLSVPFFVVGRSTPATSSAVTYKLRFKATATGTATVRNNLNTGQMYAIEVSA